MAAFLLKEGDVIDPATIKIILYALQKMIEDEEARKRLFYIITIPVVLIILLLSFIQYIFSNPFDVLANEIGGDIGVVSDFMNEYGSEIDEAGFWVDNEYILNTDYETGDFSQYNAFDTEMFNKLMTEATKYIGMPYVWGGSSPSTSFDCSGYICWVYTKSGVYNLSRTTAQGIFNQCAKLSREEAKAGDLIFFTRTYETKNAVTHIGIYLDDGKMLHCGSPIGYADIDSSYWKSHLYAFGRLPIVTNNGESEKISQ